MRELKFRAWHGSKMFSPCAITWGFIDDPSYCEVAVRDKGDYRPGPSSYPVDEVVLMQFTGLLDKNRKEIYEGDIVKMYLDKYQGEITGTVTWSRMASQWWVEWNNGTKNYKPLEPDYGDECLYAQYIEVIGNIHENPELTA